MTIPPAGDENEEDGGRPKGAPGNERAVGCELSTATAFRAAFALGTSSRNARARTMRWPTSRTSQLQKHSCDDRRHC